MRGMIRRVALAAAGALFGGLAGAAALILLYTYAPALVINMAHDRPGLLRGFYKSERSGDVTFAWTSDRGDLRLPGIDRNVEWIVRARVRGARPEAASLPEVTLLADGVVLARRNTSNAFEDIEAVVPVRIGLIRGLTLTIASSNTFVPGGGDPRTLGIQVDRIILTPARHGVFPPRRAVAAAALASGIFGAIFGLLGATAATAVWAATLLAVAQAAVLRLGLGPFAPWLSTIDWLAAGIGTVLLATVMAIERWRGEPLRHTARFALMFTGCALFLKLLVLLHPDKYLIDAMLHAHRLQAVMDGKYVFTSIAPGGYTIPYPIGLYVAALPFARIVPDHVLLLRVIAAGAEAVSAVFLYWMLARTSRERLAAAVAAAIVQLMPLGFGVLAAANLTHVFAQATAVIAMALVAVALAESDRWRIVLAGVATLVAFLSHASTFAMLTGMLTSAGVLVWVAAESPGPRRQARRILVMVLVTIGLAVALCYGRFGPTFGGDYARTRGEVAGSATAARLSSLRSYQPGGASIPSRAQAVPRLAGAYFTWPFLVLSLAGLGLGFRARRRDPCWLVVCGWMLACAGFLVPGVVTPTDFRHYYAAMPAVSILAALAAVYGWQAGGPLRVLATTLTLAGTAVGVNHWLGILEARVF
jgi:hypothetical protein